MKLIKIILPLSIFIQSCAVSPIQNLSIGEFVKDGEVLAGRMQIKKAQEMFALTGQDISCYKIISSRKLNGEIWISFVLYSDKKEDQNIIVINESKSQNCRYGITYVFGRNNGNFLREFYSR